MLFIDTHSLYHSALHKHDDRIDYVALMEYLNAEYKFRYKYAYVAETETSSSFTNFLRGMNFIVLTKETDCFDVDISIQSLRGLTDLNITRIVYCTSSKRMSSLFDFLIEQKIDVHVHGCNIPAYNNVFARELPKKVLQYGDVVAR